MLNFKSQKLDATFPRNTRSDLQGVQRSAANDQPSNLARLPRTLGLRLEQDGDMIDADLKRSTKPTLVYLTEPSEVDGLLSGKRLVEGTGYTPLYISTAYDASRENIPPKYPIAARREFRGA